MTSVSHTAFRIASISGGERAKSDPQSPKTGQNMSRELLTYSRTILPISPHTQVEPENYYILSRASEAGSPTNRPGSDKTRGQG